jgi:hypothetical protein
MPTPAPMTLFTTIPRARFAYELSRINARERFRIVVRDDDDSPSALVVELPKPYIVRDGEAELYRRTNSDSRARSIGGRDPLDWVAAAINARSRSVGTVGWVDPNF